MKNEQHVDHVFGGAWTEIKLEIVKKYLNFYTTALKNKNFTLLYIDAFAGSGTRTEKLPGSPILGEDEQKIIRDGSARNALNIDHMFDRYLFIENHSARFKHLEKIKAEYPNTYIKIENDDANKVIQKLALRDGWQTNKYRGVIFLDPYGNQVEWETLQSISATKSLDVWFLFPLSGVYRQASKDFESMEDYKKESLNKMFGTNDWEAAFYKSTVQEDLFGTQEGKERIAFKEMEKWIKSRLEDCFTYVSEPLPLPKRGPQMYSLFFCMSSSSDKAIGLAIKAASHILKSYE